MIDFFFYCFCIMRYLKINLLISLLIIGYNIIYKINLFCEE